MKQSIKASTAKQWQKVVYNKIKRNSHARISKVHFKPLPVYCGRINSLPSQNPMKCLFALFLQQVERNALEQDFLLINI